MRDNEIWDSHQFSQKISEYDLTVINPPTAYWAQMVEAWVQNPQLIPPNRLRLVIVGGDVLHPETLEKWFQTPLKDVRLINAYGPTEATITAATYDVPPGSKQGRVPIGRARANRSMYILDKYGNPVPALIPGELHIGGTVLAKGYLNRPRLTKERFIANPLFKDRKERLYKTGDRVRFLTDGNLDFMGRVDFQVKIRGFRIELGEIENVLLRMPQIKEAIVKAFDTENKDKVLAAYFTSSDGDAPEVAEIRAFLEEHLPDYMIPKVFVALDEMPIDPSGKINRHALPAPDLSAARVTTEYVAPRTQTEEILVKIVEEILNIDRVGVHDSFFDLGGHSMMATQVVSRIRDEFDVEISLRTLFEHPTVEGISHAITEAQAANVDEGELNELLDELEGLSEEDIEKLLKNEE